MAYSSAALVGTKESFNFVNIFNNSENLSCIITSEQETEEAGTQKFVEWLESSEIVSPLGSKTIPAGRLSPNNGLIVTYTLRDAYKNIFVLLRGLLEFSRPKGITISANGLDRTFQILVSADQVATVTKYLDTIFGWFVKEIKFKTSLKAIINFEHNVRQEQVKLYKALIASA